MTIDYNTCLVVVEHADVQKEGDWGEYKKVIVKQETGYWLNIFNFNMFTSHELYETIDTDMKLLVKVCSLHVL